MEKSSSVSWRLFLPVLVWGHQVDHWRDLAFVPPPGSRQACPRLTRHLCETGQATECIVDQQYSARAKLDAVQEQHYHLLKLILLYAAYKEQALLSMCPGSPSLYQGLRLLTQQGQQPEHRTASLRYFNVLRMSSQHPGDCA